MLFLYKFIPNLEKMATDWINQFRNYEFGINGFEQRDQPTLVLKH